MPATAPVQDCPFCSSPHLAKNLERIEHVVETAEAMTGRFTVEDVRRRTFLSPAMTRTILKDMERHGVVKEVRRGRPGRAALFEVVR
jgi:hypothetical protein